MNAEPATVRHRRISSVGGIGLAVAAALLTSACAAGQQAQTSDERTTIDGTIASVGSMDLRALSLQSPGDTPYYAVGTDVAFRVVIVNSGSTDDTLTSITTPAATNWGSYRTAADGYAVQVADQAAAKGSTATTSLPKGSQQIVIPAGNKVAYGTPIGTGELLLLKAKQRLYPGNSIKITFTFAKAGSVTAIVPVQLSDNAGTATVPEPSTTAEN